MSSSVVDSTSGQRPRRTRRARTTIGLVSACSGVAQGFGRFSFAVMLPEMVRTYLHSYSLAGSLGLANVGAYLIGTASVSGLAARRSSRHLMLFGLVLSTTGMSLMAISPSLFLTFVAMVLAGIGGSFIWVPAPGMAAKVAPPRLRGLAMGLAAAGIGVAVTVSAQLARSLANLPGQSPWRVQWGIQAACTLVVLILAVAYLPKEQVGTSEVRGRARDLTLAPGWRSVTLAYTAYGLSYALFFTFFVAEIEKHSHLSTSRASFDYGIIGLVSIFGGVFAGRVSDRVGRVPVMATGFVMMAGSSLLVLYGGGWAQLVAAVAFGLPMSGVANAVAAYVGDLVPPRSFSGAFGLVTLCFGVTQAIANQLGGTLATLLGGFAVDFKISLVAAMAGAALSLSAGHFAKRARRAGLNSQT